VAAGFAARSAVMVDERVPQHEPAPEQCEGCSLYTAQVRELSFLHSRDVTYATFGQGPYEESARYRDFMG
jgi:predicted dithiol-disulfide oxidoreductase (DUF899 family)